MLLLRWLWFVTKVLAISLWWLLSIITKAARSAVSADFRLQGSLGTARWASAWERVRYGLYRGKGLVIGTGAFGRLMRFNRDGVVHVFANTGTGKGVGIVIPTLLDYPGSIVVTDIKGENYGITARHRSKLGHVYMLNPGDIAHSARFNPLDTIRVGTDQESDDAAALAELMVIRDGPDAHWSTKSISLLSALILHAVYAPHEEQRTLAYVRRLSLAQASSMREQIEEIARTSESMQARDIASAFLRSMGDDEKTMPEFLSVLSDLDKATEPWGAGTPAGQLSAHSTFSLEDLNKPETMTVYLCVDEEKLMTYRRWLRVMTGCTLTAIMRSKRTQRPKHKVILLYDEARALGRLEPLVNAVGYLRTYCTPVIIWQNLPQARAVYDKQAGEFLANATCRVFFGTNDNETAKEASLMCGQAPIRTQSTGRSQSSEAWLRENRSENESESGYWLIDPSEVQRLPMTTAIVKFAHVPYPVLTRRATYYKRWRWMFRYDAWDPTVRPKITMPPPNPLPARPLPKKTAGTANAPTRSVAEEPVPPPRPYAMPAETQRKPKTQLAEPEPSADRRPVAPTSAHEPVMTATKQKPTSPTPRPKAQLELELATEDEPLPPPRPFTPSGEPRPPTGQ